MIIFLTWLCLPKQESIAIFGLWHSKQQQPLQENTAGILTRVHRSNYELFYWELFSAEVRLPAVLRTSAQKAWQYPQMRQIRSRYCVASHGDIQLPGVENSELNYTQGGLWIIVSNYHYFWKEVLVLIFWCLKQHKQFNNAIELHYLDGVGQLQR